MTRQLFYFILYDNYYPVHFCRYFAGGHRFTKMHEELQYREELSTSRFACRGRINLELLEAVGMIVMSLLLVSLFADPLVSTLLSVACRLVQRGVRGGGLE